MAAIRPRAARIQAAAQVKVQPQVIPISITGWNTRDAVAAMAPTDAVILDNWYPDAGGLTVRQGSKVFCTGVGQTYVDTLVEYSAGPNLQFLAACGSRICNITSGTSIKVGGGFTSDVWQTVNFAGRLFFVNGVDKPQSWDGTALTNAGFNGTGLTQEDLIGIEVFKGRLFLWEKNSQSFWYGALGAITGTLTEFPLNLVANTGGNLIVMTTMSHDGGEGITDLAVFILSTGEVLIYNGLDPGDPTSWALYGRYKISPPISPRAVTRYSADSYLTTFDDYVPLQQQLVALKVGQIPPRSKISGAVQKAVASSQGPYGWQSIYYPRGRRLIFNVPNPNGTFDQHIYNVQQDAYCRFTGNNGSCWSVFNSNLYYGGANGIVYQADIDNTDSGTAITFDGQPAWNDFGSPQRKRLSAVRPNLGTLGIAPYRFGTAFDYEEVQLISSSQTIPTPGSPWDISPWDISPWSPEAGVYARWTMAGGTGVAMGFRLRGAAQVDLQWLRTDIRYETGKDL